MRTLRDGTVAVTLLNQKKGCKTILIKQKIKSKLNIENGFIRLKPNLKIRTSIFDLAFCK